MDKNVKFIRKNGRVIPIHTNKNNYTGIMSKSAKYEIGTGLGVLTGGSILAHRYRQKALFALGDALKISKQKKFIDAEGGTARDLYKLSKYVNSRAGKSIKYTKIAGRLRHATFYLSSGFLAAGIQSIAASRIKDPTAKTEFDLTAGSFLAGMGGTVIARRLGLKTSSLQYGKLGRKLFKMK